LFRNSNNTIYSITATEFGLVLNKIFIYIFEILNSLFISGTSLILTYNNYCMNINVFSNQSPQSPDPKITSVPLYDHGRYLCIKLYDNNNVLLLSSSSDCSYNNWLCSLHPYTRYNLNTTAVASLTHRWAQQLNTTMNNILCVLQNTIHSDRAYIIRIQLL